jgi:hypothetical protein
LLAAFHELDATMTIRVFAPLLAIALAGCSAKPISQTDTGNNDLSAALIAVIDGCKIYRFVDGGRTVYFAKCGAAGSTSWERSCGKGCTEHDMVTSVSTR